MRNRHHDIDVSPQLLSDVHYCWPYWPVLCLLVYPSYDRLEQNS